MVERREKKEEVVIESKGNKIAFSTQPPVVCPTFALLIGSGRDTLFRATV